MCNIRHTVCLTSRSQTVFNVVISNLSTVTIWCSLYATKNKLLTRMSALEEHWTACTYCYDSVNGTEKCRGVEVTCVTKGVTYEAGGCYSCYLEQVGVNVITECVEPTKTWFCKSGFLLHIF